MVPYHLMNAKNLESAILGGYADFMARTHPDAPTPPVFLAEGLLKNAEQLRENMGDAKFFEMLNKGKGGWWWLGQHQRRMECDDLYGSAQFAAELGDVPPTRAGSRGHPLPGDEEHGRVRRSR